MKKLQKKFPLAMLLLIVAASVPLQHAQSVTQVRVLSSPEGPWFYVDNTLFYKAMTAFWSVGSVHRLNAPSGNGYAYNQDATIQWQFQGWTAPNVATPGNPVDVIADPSVTQYTAVYSTQYQFTLKLSCGPDPCSGLPGVVDGSSGSGTVNPTLTNTSWQPPGATLVLQAYPNAGFVFSGWQVGNSSSLVGTPFYNVNLSTPVTVTAVFLPARTVNFTVNPAGLGLQYYVDRTLATPPFTLRWGQGTVHNLSPIDVQQDFNGKRWVFQSWSDGGAFSHDFKTPAGSQPVTITANLAPAAYPFFLTSPPNLNLVVDNLVLPPPYSYIWGVGETHRVVAPATQTDSKGNTWTFKSWDDLVTTNVRDVTIPVGADVNNFRLTALYTSQARLNVNSSVSGLTVSVDGTPCATPCSVLRENGAQVRISAPLSIPGGDNSRQDFLGWSTGGASLTTGDWVGTVDGNVTVSAAYHLMNRLAANASPSDGASWSILPASTDGFYDSQTQVNIGVSARPGYRFNAWTGDLSGSVPNGSLSMSAPRQVMAQLSKVPYIAPNGVSNAAGIVPESGIAPGSVASIFGASLAANIAVGPQNPLPQTLGGVIVHIGDRLLPLYFASPTQINLQIPPDLPVGKQTITVSSQGMPDVKSDFNIVRNAPGLFPFVLDGQTLALVLHENGTLVTPSSPAHRGELLTTFGTGFGPTTPVRPEGMAVPMTPRYATADAVSMQLGETVFTAESAFAAPGQIGLDIVQFRLADTTPAGSLKLLLSVNGVASNTLNLPVE